VNVLAFDTALESCSVALQTSTGEVFCEHIQQDRGHAEILVPKIKEIMEKADVSFHDLNLLTTTVGPGSFTGLRIGVATAQGYSLSTGLPLIGLTTLEMLAHSVPSQERRIIAIIDSKRGDFYYQIFDEQKIPLTQPDIITIEQVAEKIVEKAVVLVGNGSLFIAPYLKNCNFEIYSHPIDARILIPLATQRYREGKTLGHPNDCKPLYLREADAVAPKAPAVRILNE